jgi:hypothetical protein
MKKQYWPAFLLILAGVLLLLYQMDLFYFSRADLFSYGLTFVGIILLANSFNRPNRKGIFGGVFFTSFGVSMIFMREYIFPRDDEFGFAAFFLALALANFATIPFKTEKTTNLVWGVIFGAVGGALLWASLGYVPTWYIYELLETYWPVILIMIGAGVIYKSYYRSRKLDKVQIENQ